MKHPQPTRAFAPHGPLPLAFPLAFPLALALLAAGLTACKSSSDDTGGGASGAGTELPEHFLVAVSDRDSARNGEEVFLVNLDTDEVMDITPSLPGTTGILRRSFALSRNGRFAGVTTGDDAENGYYVVWDLVAGTTRQLAIDGSALQGGPESRGGAAPGRFLFSPDGTKLAIEAGPFSNRSYLANADGTGLVPVTSDSLFVRFDRWMDNERLLVTSYSDGDDNGYASVLNANTLALTNVSPTPGGGTDVDAMRLSMDQSTLALALYYDESSASSVQHAYSVDLATGTTFSFDLTELDDESLRIANDGSLLAFLTTDDTGVEYEVAVGDTSNGAMTIVSAPITVPSPNANEMEFVPGTNTLVYVAEHEIDGADSLYVRLPGQAATAVPETLVTDSDIEQLAVSPTGGRVAVVFDSPGLPRDQIYLVHTGPTPGLVALSDPLATDRTVEIIFSEDGQWLFAEEFDQASSQLVLRAYPLAGQATGPITAGPSWPGALHFGFYGDYRDSRLWQLGSSNELLYVTDGDYYGREDLYLTDLGAPGSGRTIALGPVGQGATGSISQAFVRELSEPNGKR